MGTKINVGESRELSDGKVVRRDLDENGAEVDFVTFNPVPEIIAEYVDGIPGITASEYAYPLSAMSMLREANVDRARHMAHYMSPVEVALRGARQAVEAATKNFEAAGALPPDSPVAQEYYKANHARNAFANMYMDCHRAAELDWRAGIDNRQAHAAADAAIIARFVPTADVLNSPRLHPS